MTAQAGLTSKAVADLVGGRLRGSGDVLLTGVRSLEHAGVADLSFLVSPKYLAYFRASHAGAVLTGPDGEAEPGGPAERIIVRDVAGAVERVLARLNPLAPPPSGIHPTATIGKGSAIGEGVWIGPQAVVGERVRIGARSQIGPAVVLGNDVSIGEDSRLDAHVVCYDGVEIGNRVVMMAACVIGGDGFGYASDATGHRHLRHIGGCVIEDDVTMGSGCLVDRGRLEETRVGQGTKMDNVVHVGHNARIGKHCLLMAGVLLGGSSQLGDRVILAGGAAVRDHGSVGAGARVAAMSGIIGDVPAGETWGGYPARPHREFLRAQATLYAVAPHATALTTLLAERGADGPSND